MTDRLTPDEMARQGTIIQARFQVEFLNELRQAGYVIVHPDDLVQPVERAVDDGTGQPFVPDNFFGDDR